MIADDRSFSPCSSPRSAPDAVLPWASTRRQRQPGMVNSGDALCHHSQPHSTKTTKPHQHDRRRVATQRWLNLQSLIFAVMFCLVFSCPGAGAHGVYVASPLEERTELVFDRSEPPAQPKRLHARQETTISLPTSTSSSTNISASASSSASSVASGISTAAPTGFSPLPTPFDSSLGNNFTASSCPEFFQSFLSNSTFNECKPFSLLLQVCHSHFAHHLLVLIPSRPPTASLPPNSLCFV